MRPFIPCALGLLLLPAGVHAQPVADPARIVFADLGYARTYDDEGFLGRGAAISAGAGVRLSPRWTLQGIVERIPYYRDVDYLTFDGRVVFAGAEMAFRSRRPKVRPTFSAGVGVMHDSRVWIRKTQTGPGLPRNEEPSTLSYTLAAMTASVGVDIPVSRLLSLRPGLRFHGLLDTGDDLAPHTILQPTFGAAMRW